jgi:hypothetical protein
MTIDINVVGAITGSIFAAAAIVPVTGQVAGVAS